MNQLEVTMETSLFKLFEAAASTYPDAIATIFDDGDIVSMATYSDVLKSSLMVANFLANSGWQDQGVGVYAGTGPNLPNVLLGILSVPCCFVPLDPRAPHHMTAHVISATKLQLVLVQAPHLTKFIATVGQEYVVEFCDSKKISLPDFVIIRIQPEGSGKSSSANRQPGLAYVMHTSGTTGTPKVIRVPHKCILPNILHLRKALNISKYDVIFNAAAMTFDTSIVEMFLALSQGASLLIVPSAVKLMPRRLVGILMRNHVTVIQATPTLIQSFNTSLLRSHLFGANTTLRLMIFGGEACPTPAMIRQWRCYDNQTQFYNIYGITEVSCWATLYRIPEEDISNNVNQSVPLGDPLNNTIIEVRDEQGHAVSFGTGTVFIGGTSRVCYLDHEDILPLSKPVMRDTGDVVEVTQRGLLYLGRHDDQIKRHGKRITLTHIQQSVEMLSTLSSCAAIFDNEQILLFCVPANKQISPIPQCIASTDPLISQLTSVLPSHGIPDQVYWVHTLPLTLHGKLDRKGLLHLATSVKGDDGTETDDKDGDVHGKLLKLWQVMLPQDTAIDDTSNFLILGGDSFQAVHMATQMEMCYRTSLLHFVDKLLHRSLKEVVAYVEETLFKCESTEQNDCNGLSTESKTGRKRPHPEACPEDADYLNDTSDAISQDSSHHQCCVTIRRGSQTISPTHCNCTAPNTVHVDTAIQKYSGLKLRWQYDTGKCVDASPLFVKSRSRAVVYIGSHSHKFAAISMETGVALWERTLGDRIESSACLSTCGEFVIVGCYDNHVYFLHSMSGTVYWKYRTEGSVRSSPVADTQSSLVYVGSHDQHLYALSIKDKSCPWQVHCGDGSVFSSPFVYYPTHTVYVGTLAGNLVAVDKTNGQLLWKYRCPKPIFSSPVASVTGVVIGCADELMYCISHAGDKLWTFKTEAPIFSSPSSTPQTRCKHSTNSTQPIVFGSHDHHVYCLDQATGKLIWRTKLASQVYATPFIFHRQQVRNILTNETHDESTNRPIRRSVRLSNRTTQPIGETVSKSTETGREIKESAIGRNQHDALTLDCIVKAQDKTMYQSETQTSKDNSTFVAVSCTAGQLAILDIIDGNILATYDLPGEVFSSPIVYSDQIIVGCRDDYVYSLDIT